MTSQTQRVLEFFLRDPEVARYCREIGREAGLMSGTVVPLLARLEREAGWLESFWEDAAEHEKEGRPRRRYYRLTASGAAAAQALARARAKPGSPMGQLNPGSGGATCAY
jgi:DNA-binding PadR family transcriptional regulator